MRWRWLVVLCACAVTAAASGCGSSSAAAAPPGTGGPASPPSTVSPASLLGTGGPAPASSTGSPAPAPGYVPGSAIRLVARSYPALGFAARLPVIPGVSVVQAGPGECEYYCAYADPGAYYVIANLARRPAGPLAYCRLADAGQAARWCPAIVETYQVAVYPVPGWAVPPWDLRLAEEWYQCPAARPEVFHGLAADVCVGAPGPPVILLVRHHQLYALSADGTFARAFLASVTIS